MSSESTTNKSVLHGGEHKREVTDMKDSNTHSIDRGTQNNVIRAMSDEEFGNILSEWSEFGDDPVELFKEYGYADDTLKLFTDKITDSVDVELYRYRRVNSKDLKIGGYVNFDIPTSWSGDSNIPLAMSEGYPDVSFFKLTGNKKGILNYRNMYKEEQEYILRPMRLKIIDCDGKWFEVKCEEECS